MRFNVTTYYILQINQYILKHIQWRINMVLLYSRKTNFSRLMCIDEKIYINSTKDKNVSTFLFT